MICPKCGGEMEARSKTTWFCPLCACAQWWRKKEYYGTDAHELKCLPEYYEAVRENRKTFELRKNDRGFRVGDVVRLKEYDGSSYTGRELVRRITYILEGPVYGLENGWCILGLGYTR